MDAVINFLLNGINSVFRWFDELMTAIPGAWDIIFSFILFIIISRFIIAPLLGSHFGGLGSDRASKREPRSTNFSQKVKKGR